jgi:hypothetical protein
MCWRRIQTKVFGAACCDWARGRVGGFLNSYKLFKQITKIQREINFLNQQWAIKYIAQQQQQLFSSSSDTLGASLKSL